MSGGGEGEMDITSLVEATQSIACRDFCFSFI